MKSIVVHYKELALKGKNRPWFIQLLVRNLKTALAGLHVAAVRSIMGRIELELRPDTPWEEVRERLRRVFGIANFSYANRGPHDFNALASAILADLGDREAASFRVSATRSDKRLPFTSPQVEREVGGLIKEAKGWHVDLEHPGADRAHRDAAGRRVLFLRQGAGRGRPADGDGRPRGVPAVGRHRFAGGRVPHDAPRLLGAADSFSQLPDSVARVAGEGPRDRRAADDASAAVAADAGAVRRAAAAGRARRAARAARRDLSPPDAADRRAAGAAGARARW